MTHLHNLHLATENPERPAPAFVHAWFVLLVFIAGFLLGVAVMWVTDYEPPGQSLIVRP